MILKKYNAFKSYVQNRNAFYYNKIEDEEEYEELCVSTFYKFVDGCIKTLEYAFFVISIVSLYFFITHEILK